MTLRRYGGLFKDSSDAAVKRLDALMNRGVDPTTHDVPNHRED